MSDYDESNQLLELIVQLLAATWLLEKHVMPLDLTQISALCATVPHLAS